MDSVVRVLVACKVTEELEGIVGGVVVLFHYWSWWLVPLTIGIDMPDDDVVVKCFELLNNGSFPCNN